MATPSDSTDYARETRGERALRLLELANSLPKKLAAQGIQSAIDDPAQAAKNIGKATAKTVSVAVSPGLYILQQMGLRTSAGVAGAIEPPIEYAQGRFHGAPEDVLRQSVKGAAKGVLRMEAPKGGPPATATSDVLRRAGYTHSFIRDSPFLRKQQMLGAIITGTALGPKGAELYARGTDWLTGPDAAGMGLEIAAGEGLNRAAGQAGYMAKNMQPLGFPDVTAPRSLQEGVSQIGDKARQLRGVRRVVGAFSEMGMGTVQRKVVDPTTGEVIAENAREGLRQGVREMVGERTNLVSRFRNQIAGGEEAIYDGASRYGMTPIERSKYLEDVRQHATSKGRFTYDEYVHDDLITPKEGEFLQRVQEYLDEMVPAGRVARGLKGARLYATAQRASEKAGEAVARVKKLAEEGRQMILGERPKYFLDASGVPRENESVFSRKGFGPGRGGKSTEREDLRRDLIKAIMDADFSLRSFSRASRYKMKPVDFDRAHMWDYSLEELLGFTEQLTQAERGALGMTQFDRAFLPVKSQTRLVIRSRGEPGYPLGIEGRAYDKYGNEVWRTNKVNTVDEALAEARRTQGLNVEFVDQSNKRWATDKAVRGPRKSPIPELTRAGAEASDYQNIFVNYLPRYESEEVLGLTRKMKAGKKTGISTGFGGARISAPTTTQEEARDLIRNAYVARAKEQNVSGKITPIEEPLQSLTEALETHATRNASAIAKGAFLSKAGKNFGVYTTDPIRVSQLRADGWLPIGKLKGSLSGMDDYLRNQLSNTYVPESVFNGMASLDRVMQPVDRVGLNKFFHNVLQVEKTYLTTVNPRFSVRNRIWEVMVSSARGNNKIENWVDAAKILSGKYGDKMVPGFNMTGNEMIAFLRREGVLGEGISTEVATRGGAFRNRTQDLWLPSETAEQRAAAQYESQIRGPNRPPPLSNFNEPTAKEIGASLVQGMGRKLQKGVQVAGDINQEGEQLSRLAHWLWAIRDKKMSWAGARKEVATTMFDYARDFYTIEEAQLKEWIPFYSWFRRIVPLTMRTAFERPGEFTKMGSIMTHVNAMNGVSPEEMQYMGRTYLNSVGIVLPDDKNQPPGTKRAVNIPFGFGDPGQFVQMTPELSETAPGGALTGVFRGAAGALRPEMQLIPAFIWAQSPMGEKYTGEIVKLPTVLLWVPKPVQERLGIDVIDGIPWGPSTLIPLTRYLQGGWGEAAGGLKSSNPRAQARFASWLTGLTVDPEVPFEQNQMNEVRGDLGQMMDEIGRQRRGMRRMQEALMQAGNRESAKQDTSRARP